MASTTNSKKYESCVCNGVKITQNVIVYDNGDVRTDTVYTNVYDGTLYEVVTNTSTGGVVTSNTPTNAVVIDALSNVDESCESVTLIDLESGCYLNAEGETCKTDKYAVYKNCVLIGYKHLDSITGEQVENSLVTKCVEGCPCEDEAVPDCWTGTGKSKAVGVLKYDVNPLSFSESTLQGSEIKIKSTLCGARSITFENTPLPLPTIGADGNPVLEVFADAFNALGENWCMFNTALDEPETNQVNCYQVPTGIGDVKVVICTPNGSTWESTYNSANDSFSVVDDIGTLITSGSAVQK